MRTPRRDAGERRAAGGKGVTGVGWVQASVCSQASDGSSQRGERASEGRRARTRTRAEAGGSARVARQKQSTLRGEARLYGFILTWLQPQNSTAFVFNETHTDARAHLACCGCLWRHRQPSEAMRDSAVHAARPASASPGDPSRRWTTTSSSSRSPTSGSGAEYGIPHSSETPARTRPPTQHSPRTATPRPLVPVLPLISRRACS